MKPVVCAVVLALAAAAGCASDSGPPSPVDAAGNYIRESGTDDITVSIRIPAAVRSLPGVGDRIVAQSESIAADAARRAADGRKEGWNAFVPTELLIEWIVTWERDGIVSAVGESSISEGGQPAKVTRRTVVYDRALGRPLSLAELFADPRPDGAAMTALSQVAFAGWAEASPQVAGRDLSLVDERTLTDAREGLRAVPESFRYFALEPAQGDRSRVGAITLYYDAGVLAGEADGPYTLTVPVRTVARHFAPDWAQRLGVRE